MVEISVIIPTYNDAETLPLTIKTLEDQDFEDFEVIIVNDGGAKPESFLELKSEKFKIINLEKNEGVSRARNVGMSSSSGNILYFLDADDYVCPDLLSFVSGKMSKENCNFFSVRHKSVNVDEIEKNLSFLNSSNRLSEVEVLSPEKFFKVYSGVIVFIPSTVFFRRSALLKAVGENPWDLELRNAQDTLLILKMGAKYGITQSLEKFVMYSVRSDSLSRKPMRTWNARMKAMDMLLNDLTKSNDSKPLIKVARKMRHNAARRIARLHFANGEKKRGLEVLTEDLKMSFNIKSLIEIPRITIFRR